MLQNSLGPDALTTYYVLVRGAQPDADGASYEVLASVCDISPPALTIRHEDEPILEWPLHAVGLQLKASAGVDGPWLPVQLTPEVTPHAFRLPWPQGSPTQFFRLDAP